MMKERKINLNISLITIYIAVLLAINSAAPWYIWHNEWFTLLLIIVFVICRVLFYKFTIKKNQIPSIISCLILYSYMYWFHSPDISSMFSTIITKTLPVVLLILFSNEEKKIFLETLINIVAFIGFLSISYYLLWILGVPLPHSTIAHRSSFYPEFTNYYLFITPGEYTPFTRFRSILTEPGHLGMYAAIFLYINSYNFKKWQTWSLFIQLILSFSLSGYVLLAIGILVHLWATKLQIVKFLVITGICSLIVASIGIFIYKEYEDSVLSTHILSRLVIEDGKLSGDNRNTSDYEEAYNKFLDSNKSIIGIGREKFGSLPFKIAGDNCSYKDYIFQYGKIGISLLLLFFYCLIYPKTNKLYWGLFILYFFSFIQRPFALWEIELFPFISFSSYCNSLR